MANFRFEVANPKTRKTHGISIEQEKASGLLGKKIGETFNGSLIGLSGYELQITGGSDKDGFPMVKSVHGASRKRIVLANPPGFHPSAKGERRRKSVHGNTISRDIIQVNAKVVKEGSKPLEELVAKKEEKKETPAEPKKEEKPKERDEEKKEKPKEEKKPEKKEPKQESSKEQPKEQKKEDVKEQPKQEKKEGG